MSNPYLVNSKALFNHSLSISFTELFIKLPEYGYALSMKPSLCFLGY
jgi:hypothetical protein